MKKLEDYTPSELATLATVTGVIIASKLNINGQNVIGNFIEGVGQIVLIIAAQAQNLQAQEQNQNSGNSSSNAAGKNADLQKQIDELKEQMKKFENNC
ncbi:hypothetical protein [Clostridium sp.]|uniref:hypothetical protein n=1 Tax=Clostridium sp. TaxID=1506 RepID=UPI003D6C9935